VPVAVIVYSISFSVATVGAPLISPLVEFNFNPRGRLGLIEYFKVALLGLIPLAFKGIIVVLIRNI
jgi:hypothetical protein